MSSSSLLARWGGLAVMVAGVLLLVAELLELLPAFDDYPFSELALTGLFALQQALYLLGLILLSVGLVGCVSLPYPLPLVRGHPRASQEELGGKP
jgi:hypothetical protein